MICVLTCKYNKMLTYNAYSLQKQSLVYEHVNLLYPVGSVNRRTAVGLIHWKLHAFPPEIFIHGHYARQIWRAAKGIGPRLEREHMTESKQNRTLCFV